MEVDSIALFKLFKSLLVNCESVKSTQHLVFLFWQHSLPGGGAISEEPQRKVEGGFETALLMMLQAELV